MKILYVVTQADRGGAQKYTLAMAKHFNGAIAAGMESGDLFTAAQLENIETFPLPNLRRRINPWYDVLAFFELYRLIKKYKPDVVHLNSSKAGFLGSFAGKLAGTKVVFTAHGFRFNEPLASAEVQMYKDLERLASLCRDHIIAISETERSSAIANHIIHSDKITIVYNGIPEISFMQRTEARKELTLSQEAFIFGTIANCYVTKGLDILVNAVALLPKEIQNKCQFVIIGNGPEFTTIQSQIEKNNLQNTILLLGSVKDASNYLKAFDAFVLPSRKEGVPYTLLEAMQAGLPIIATEVGGNKEILGEGSFTVAPENPKELADALQDLFHNSSTRTSLSQKMLGQSSLFTESKMFEETKKVYQKISNQ